MTGRFRKGNKLPRGPGVCVKQRGLVAAIPSYSLSPAGRRDRRHKAGDDALRTVSGNPEWVPASRGRAEIDQLSRNERSFRYGSGT